VSKSTPLKRSPIFIFGPPVLFSILGVVLLVQSETFTSPKLEIVTEQIEINKAEGLVPPTPALSDYLYPRLTIDWANQPYVVVNKLRTLNPIDYAPSNLVVMPSSESLDNSRNSYCTFSRQRARAYGRTNARRRLWSIVCELGIPDLRLSAPVILSQRRSNTDWRVLF